MSVSESRRNLSILGPVIHDDKPSLPLCAFGAGAAHAAVLAFALPIMITLPAPGADTAPGQVAIHVEILSAPPEPAVAIAEPAVAVPAIAIPEMGEGDVEEDPVGILEAVPEETTGALPEPSPPPPPPLVQEAALTPPADMEEPVAEVEVEDAPSTAVANIGPEDAPAIVPLPARKPGLTRQPAEPVPTKRVTATKQRTRSVVTTQPAFKGILGGRRATPMPEYRLPGQ